MHHKGLDDDVPPGQVVTGFHDVGHLHIGGRLGGWGEHEAPLGALSHEIAHLIDTVSRFSKGHDPEDHYKFSSDPKWVEAWKSELSQGQFGKYSAMNPEEGI